MITLHYSKPGIGCKTSRAHLHSINRITDRCHLCTTIQRH